MQMLFLKGFFRRNPRSGWVIKILFFGAMMSSISSAQAAYLEQDKAVWPSITHRAPVRPMIRPIPESEASLRQLIRHVEIGQPIYYRRLTVFPLILRREPSSGDIRTLDEALSHDWITLREHEAARVPEIRVRNESQFPVFLMAGEIISGGRQNRIIRNDTLLPPSSGFIDLPVYCGEKERWAGTRDVFSSPNRMADHSLRKMAGSPESQDEIWREIDDKLEKSGVAAATHAYQQIYEDRGVNQELSRATTQFKKIVRRDTVGAVFVDGDDILCCDVFSDPDLFSRLWEKISRSYALETIWTKGRMGITPDRPPLKDERFRPGVGPADIRRFLGRVMEADIWTEETSGMGRFIRLRGAVTGSALIWRDEVVHAGIFMSQRYTTQGERE